MSRADARPLTARVDVSVLTSGHNVADARLHREVAALRARRLTVEVLGLGDAADAPAGVAARTWARPGMAARAALAVRLPLLARGRVLLALDPDSGLTACLIGRARGRRVVVDVHEDYAALLGDRGWARRFGGVPGLLGRLLVGLGLRVFRGADLVVVADEHVPPAAAPRRLVVRNLPDTSMLPPPGPRADAPRALYIGDLRASRGLFAMVEAVRRAPGWHLDLVGPVAPSDAPRLEAVLAADSGLAARVRLHGRQPPAEAWRWGAGAWAGLLLLTATPAFRDAVPSKLYEYLACGLPVITTDLPRSAELVRAADAGAVVAGGADDAVAEEVARVLRDWAADPAAFDALRDRLQAEAAQVTRRRTPYEELADAMLELADPGSDPAAARTSRPPDSA
ncbi:MAG: glycosyltransferase family 4 protein [Austwickia sp.]|jgi:glycosyltransferase involved in cell wall biosynthesis|nr:MAG: glycosyltransferase family 4 protein [Austwickia sp.]